MRTKQAERIPPSIVVDGWLSGSNDAELEALVTKHASTLAPLEAAEREHAEALRRREAAEAALLAAERVFDADPIEANDRAEKELRASRDLAVSRAERARQRVEDGTSRSRRNSATRERTAPRSGRCSGWEARPSASPMTR